MRLLLSFVLASLARAEELEVSDGLPSHEEVMAAAEAKAEASRQASADFEFGFKDLSPAPGALVTLLGPPPGRARLARSAHPDAAKVSAETTPRRVALSC